MPSITLDESAADPKAATAQPEAETTPTTEEEAKGKEGEETTETVEESTTTEETTEEEASLDMDNITRNKDGVYVWRVDPDDPNSTFYTGKSLKEVIQNAQKGIKEKDTTIRKYKADKVRPPEDVEDITSGETRVEFPRYEDILREAAQTQGVQLEPLGWSEDQWKEFESEHGTRAALKLEQNLQAIQQASKEQFDRENVSALNSQTLFDETDAVRDYLVEQNVDIDKFDYQDILATIHSEKKNFMANGVRKPGVIMREVAKVVSKMAKSTTEQKARQHTTEEIATKRLTKEKLPEEKGGRGGVTKGQTVPYKSTQEALDSIKRELKLRQ